VLLSTQAHMEALPHQRGHRRQEAQVIVMDNEIWSLTSVANEKTMGQRSYNQKRGQWENTEDKGDTHLYTITIPVTFHCK
jgi:hypothetical protein